MLHRFILASSLGPGAIDDGGEVGGIRNFVTCVAADRAWAPFGFLTSRP